MRIFRTGPALLIPAVYLWAVVSNLLCDWSECNDLWRTLPLHVALAAVIVWHATLIVVERDRTTFDWLYAIIHIPTFYYFWMIAIAIAIKFPL
jgi:hypothetical protein